MNDNGKFEFSYSAPTEAERREIEDIKRQYVPKEEKEDKLERLRGLNRRVTRPPRIAAAVLAVAGTLILGLGMAMALEWNIIVWGSVVGLVGVGIAAAAYPVYRAVLKRNKQRYGQEIINLSNELLNKN